MRKSQNFIFLKLFKIHLDFKVVKITHEFMNLLLCCQTDVFPYIFSLSRISTLFEDWNFHLILTNFDLVFSGNIWK